MQLFKIYGIYGHLNIWSKIAEDSKELLELRYKGHDKY